MPLLVSEIELSLHQNEIKSIAFKQSSIGKLN